MTTQVTIRSKDKPLKPKKPFRGFSLSDATDSRLDALAAKFKVSRSEVIRQLVDQTYEGEFSKANQ